MKRVVPCGLTNHDPAPIEIPNFDRFRNYLTFRILESNQTSTRVLENNQTVFTRVLENHQTALTRVLENNQSNLCILTRHQLEYYIESDQTASTRNSRLEIISSSFFYYIQGKIQNLFEEIDQNLEFQSELGHGLSVRTVQLSLI